ncbi:ArsA family ATPase [Sciscionella marina]|uniref:ArsA family ATPase n=1 Tax=Sciscionella marina TaxID=508770 RepID=UPI00037C5E8D|nr:ArsA family ATPase [Sciscionella marina]
MRVTLFTGKGGVGKTTIAAATAARLARSGRRVLVVSTDPAHSLGDAFGTELGAEPLEVESGLHAGHIDARGLVDQSWAQLRTHLRGMLAGAGVDEVDAEELTVLPGVDELLSLVEVHRLVEQGAADGRWEAVLVDCGPTAETLRLLALPEAFSGYLGKFFPSGKGAGLLRAGLLGGDQWAATRQALGTLGGQLAALRGLLTDRARTSVRLVLTPERVVIAETRRTLTALALQGIRVDGVIANRLVPKAGLGFGPAANWMRTRRAEQDAVLREVRTHTELEVRTVEHRANEPVGADALATLATDLYGRADPLAEHEELDPPLLSVHGGGTEYRLHIAIPLAEDARLELARIGDDLAVTVDGRRRLISLPSVLRRTEVRTAEVDTEGIVVRMRAL